MALSELLQISIEFSHRFPSVEVVNETGFAIGLIDTWQRSHNPHEILATTKDYISRNGQFGNVTNSKSLAKIPGMILDRRFMLTANRLQILNEFNQNFSQVEEKTGQGHLIALAMFSDPESLKTPKVIYFDDLFVGGGPSAGSTNLAGDIYILYPYLYETLDEFLPDLHLMAGHEIFHYFRQQRHPVEKYTLGERFTHEALASLIYNNFYLDDGQVEEDIDFWLPLTLKHCQTDIRDTREDIFQAVADQCKTWSDPMKPPESTRASITDTLDSQPKGKKDRRRAVSDIFHDEAFVFLKVSRYVANQIYHQGGIDAIRQISDKPPVNLLAMYNQLGCTPQIPSHLPALL